MSSVIMTERKALDRLFAHFSNYNYRLFNSFIYDWESDFFAISKSGYALECEVKVSRADYFKDFEKPKHRMFMNCDKKLFCKSLGTYTSGISTYNQETKQYEHLKIEKSNVSFIDPKLHSPNKFYYAVPYGLITPAEVPSYAGLLYITDTIVEEVVRAPFLHKQQNNLNSVLLSKYYNKFINIRSELNWMLNDIKNHIQYEDQKENLQRFIDRLY